MSYHELLHGSGGPILCPIVLALLMQQWAPVAKAATEAELRAQVLAEHPELGSDTVTQWEVVQALRHFAYVHTDTVVSVSSPLYGDLSGWAVPDVYEHFDADAGGVVCGGTADALRKLYQLWGFEAWYLGFGDTSSGGFTHAENLVRIEHDGQSIITLHDAQLDAGYGSVEGEPVDYIELVALLAAGRGDELALLGGEDNPYADILVHDDDLGSMSIHDMAAANWTSDPADYTTETLSTGVQVIHSPRKLSRFEQVIGPWYQPFLAGQGLPEEIIYLHLFPFQVSGSDGAEEVLAAAQLAARSGEPVHVGFEAAEGFWLGATGGSINQVYDLAGYDVQTWYYGGTTVVDGGGGDQVLEAAYHDGIGGDYEALFEFQRLSYGQVSLELTSVVPDDPLRFAVYDGDWALLYEEMGGSGVFSWEDANDSIHAVIVEAASGGLRVDDLMFGLHPDGPGDTGEPDDTASPLDTDPPPDDTDVEPLDSGDSNRPEDDTGIDEGPNAPDCGCAGHSRGSLLLLLPLLLAVVRRGAWAGCWPPGDG